MRISFFGPIIEDAILSVQQHAETVVCFLRERGLDVTHITFARKNIPLLPASLSPALNRFLFYSLYAAARRGDVNHIFDHFYSHLVVPLGSARTVISCNSMTMPKIERRELPLPPIPWKLRATHTLRYNLMIRARTICVATEAVKADVERIFSYPSDRICVVNEGVNHRIFHPLNDVARLQQTKLRHGLSGLESPITLVVGTASPFKNRITSLKVFAEIVRRGVNSHLVLVAGALSEEENRQISAPELSGRVTHLEFVPTEDLVALYNLAAVVVFPSWDEGFGHPPLEAMACGTPTVTSDIPVLVETTGNASLHAPPGDVVALADRVEEILSDPLLSESLREKGRNRAQRFTWERYAREMNDVYNRVAESA